LKWRPDYRERFFVRHLDLTAQPPAAGKPKPDLILWPETAVPFLLDQPGDGLAMVSEAARGTPVALGIQREQGLRYYNSLAIITAGGKVGAVYDKVHLVPFGEYIPFGDALARFGISAFAAREGNGYSAGKAQAVINLGRLGKVQPLICYEAVFAQDVARVPERPDWMMQITNDDWFGKVSGPVQHLAQARFRAIEFGLPVARSANTGISALIDARGRVVESLPMGAEGVIDAPLPGSLPPTRYARVGDGPVVEGLFAALALLFAAALKSRVDRGRKRR
jgi:apolipoprotein N-acyltransferase